MDSGEQSGALEIVPGAAVRRRRSTLLPLFLRPFVSVRPDEVMGLLLLTANGLLLMMAYYLLKTVREPLILQGGGAPGLSGSELKTYATAGQAVVLSVLVPLYGHVARRLDRRRLIAGTVGLLVASLLAFAGLGRLGLAIGITYYLWMGVATLVVIAQFWSFANDYFDREQGERLFPFVAVGGSLGAVFGAGTAGWLLERVGLLHLLVAAAALLLVYASLYAAVERHRPSHPRRPPRPPRPLGRRGGFELVLKSRYLLFIGVTVLLASLVNTHGEYILARVVNTQAEQRIPDPGPPTATVTAVPADVVSARREVVGALYADFYGAVNLLALALQLLVVSRVFRLLGVHRALYVFPLVALAAYGSILAFPAFLLIAGAKTLENGADYSLHNTVRHALFLPTSRDAKYKAKVAIDTFCLRAGDLLAAGTVFAGVHLLALSVRQFALVNVALVAVWLVVVAALSRRYRSLIARTGR